MWKLKKKNEMFFVKKVMNFKEKKKENIVPKIRIS